MTKRQKYLHNEISLNGILENHNQWNGLIRHFGRHSSHFYKQVLKFTLETYKEL